MQVAFRSSRALLGTSGACQHQQPAARAVQVSWRGHQALRRAPAVLVVASNKRPKTTGNAALDDALVTGRELVDSAANLVPADVPRPVAKIGVAVTGGIIAFWLLQKVLSTLLTVVLLAGAAWLYLQSSGGSSSSRSSSSGTRSTSDGEYDDDPLSEARKIMDKYK